MIKKTALLAPALAALLLVTGCLSSSGEVTEPDIANPFGEWHALSLGGKDTASAPYATMTLEEDRVNGSTGCNRYFGKVEIGDDVLKFGAIGSTRKMCPPLGMEREEAMSKVLGEARQWQGQGSHLLILDEKGNIIAKLAPGIPTDAP